MIRLSHDQLVACIYSCDPIGEYEAILESLRNQSALTGDQSGLLEQCIDESLIEMFNAEDDGFSDTFVEEDYRDPFFEDHYENNIDDWG